MESSWVSFLIILCSRSTAVYISKGNNSIIDDFHLLDSDIQIEICNMIKETNISTQFTLEERMQVKQDFCDQLEAFNNQEIEKNSLLVDEDRSMGSDIDDQISLIGSTPFSEMKDGSSVGDLPRESISDQGNSWSLSPAIEENLQSTSSEGNSTSLVLENSKSSQEIPSSSLASSTTSLASLSSSKASTSEKVTLVTPQDTTTITADSQDQNSTEPSGNFNQREIILNSNTQMIPDPTYSDEKFNSSNSLKLINHGEYSSESTSTINYSAKNDQSADSNNDEYSCSCYEDKNKKTILVAKNSKSIPNSKHKKCYKCLRKGTTAEVKVLHPLKFSTYKSNESKSSIKETCSECSTTGFFECMKNTTNSTSESSGSSSRDSSTEVPNENSSELSQLMSFENPTSATAATKGFPGEYYVLPGNIGDTNAEESAKKCNRTTEESKEYTECHKCPSKKKDLSKKESHEKFTTLSTTEESDPCSECRLSTVSWATSETPSNDSSCLKYCSSESLPYNIDLSPDILTEPPSSHDFETSYNSSLSPTDSSENTEIETVDSVLTTTKLSHKPFCESSSTPLYETPTSTSTPHFCGSSARPQPKFNTTTNFSSSLPKLTCNPNKLTVNPKSPRKSRRLTKILSSLGKLHSYSGFFKVDQQDDTRLFFWFFCNRKWKNTPLIVWLQGEPGLSSLHGLFQEHGPYYLEFVGDGFDLKLRKFAWTKEYNVLYLDHCVGCGFSSSKDNQAYIPTYEQVARNVYQGLYQFFKIWYEMLSNDLYLAGSYSGAKYIPVIAQTIHDENKVSTCNQKMNLKGLMIGGPYLDSGVMVNYNDFFLAHGIIDDVTHKDMIPLQYHAEELIRSGKYQDAIDFLNLHIYCLLSQAGYEVYKDVRYLKETREENMQNVVESEQFKRMVCTNDINFETKTDILIEQIMPPVNSLVPELLRYYKILYYNGQFDLMAPYMLTSKALLKLEWEFIDQFYMTEETNWCPQKDSNSCPEGYFRSYQNLTHVMIRNSGHFVGTTNSRSLYYLLKWFVEDKFHGYYDNENWYK